MLKVLIPAAGRGSRFHDYDLPKPLIDVNGKPMIARAIESLDMPWAEFLFILAKNKFLDQTKEAISKVCSYPKFIDIDYVTEGATCSALLFKEEINNEDELIITNCDQIMEWDSKKFLAVADKYHGCVVTYHTDTDKNSYARLNKQGNVTEIREKEVISNVSLNGIHYWKQGKYFVDSAEAMIANNDRANNGEFYIAPTYNYMIKNGLTVGVHHIPNQQHHAVGVPSDLEKFIQYEKTTHI